MNMFHHFATLLADLAFDATCPHEAAPADGAPNEWVVARRRAISECRTASLQSLDAMDGQAWPFDTPIDRLRQRVRDAGSDALSFMTTLSQPTQWGAHPDLWELEGDRSELDAIRQYAKEFRQLSDRIEDAKASRVADRG